MMDNLSSLSQNRDPLTHTIMGHTQHALLAARAKATQGLCAARRTNGQFQEKSDQPESVQCGSWLVVYIMSRGPYPLWYFLWKEFKMSMEEP